MNDQPQRDRPNRSPLNGESAGRGRAAPPMFSGRRLRPGRWLAGLLAGPLWLAMVQGLPLRSPRAPRARAAHPLPTDKPGAASVLAAFDHAAEGIVFPATGPYLILAAAAIVLIAQPVEIKRRLDVAEHAVQGLCDDVPGGKRISRE